MDNYPWNIEFEKIINFFNIKNPKIAIKIMHMRETQSVAEDIAKSLNCNKEEVELASAIGLLHDLGRFLQIERYDTFDDSKSIDHAKASVLMLFDEGIIHDFYPNSMHHSIIKNAIYNHNKFYVQENLSEYEKKFCYIIRDADKIDIYRAMANADFEDAFFNAKSKDFTISPLVKEEFYSCKMIHVSLRKTPIDDLILKLAYVFDFNFDGSRKILLQKGYLDLFVNNFIFKSGIEDEKTKQELFDMLEFAKKYIL